MIDSCIIGLEAVVFGTLERFFDPVECVFGCDCFTFRMSSINIYLVRCI